MTIAKNTLYMTAASVGQKILSFAYFTLLARMLGAEATGKYFLALSFTTMFAVVTDFGLAPTLSREVSRKPASAGEYAGHVLGMKLFFMAGAYMLVVAASGLLAYPEDIRILIYLSGLTMVFDSVHLTLYAILRGMHKLRYEAFAIGGSQLITLMIGTAALYLGAPLWWLILAFTIPSFLNVLYAWFAVRVREHIILRLRLSYSRARALLMIALPFALAGIFTRVYSFFDIILLSKLAGSMAVGYYSIPNKITYAFQFIPLALVSSLYPRMSEAFVCDKARLKSLFENALKYLIVLSVPLALGIGVLAPEIIITLYTQQFAPAIVPLQILLVSLIFAFLDFPVGALLNGCNKQAVQTAIMGVAMVVNVALNILLIPVFGIVGAAVAALVGNMTLFFFGYVRAGKIVRIRQGVLVIFFIRVLASALVMAVIVMVVKRALPWIVAIPAGAVVYFLCAWYLRVVSVADVRALWRNIVNKV